MSKMTVKTFIAFLGLVLFLFSCAEKNHLILRKGGSYIIGIEEDHPGLYRAGTALKTYLEQATHASFHIREGALSPDVSIFLSADPESMADEEIYYETRDGILLIKGGSAQSVLNCVYEFLENELGFRFYTPDETKKPLPGDLTLQSGISKRYTPPVTTRTVHSRLFYDNPEYADAQKVTHEAFPGYAPNARVHTFHRFMPAGQFFKKHPEYYALRDGERRTTQLCLTNEDVFRIVRDTVAAIKARYPEAQVISVSQDDNTQYCQCAACEKIHREESSPAGTMIRFVNRIAREFPEIMISTLAYQYTRTAPKITKPEQNVLITLCSIECDRSAPIADKCEDFARDLVEWGRITDNIRIWDYTTQFTNFLAPFPNLHTLQPNIQLFTENNAKWIFEQHSNQPSELFELRSYLTAKLLWDPMLDRDSVMNEFLEGYYGPAGKSIRKYIDLVHAELQRDSSFFLFLYGDPAQGFSSFLRKEMLEEYDQLFSKAAEEVKDDPVLLSRVNAARLSTDYAILEHAKTNLHENWLKPFYDMENRMERFEATCRKSQITSMNEMGYSVSEYLDLYASTIKRAGKENRALAKPVRLLTRPKKYAGEDPRALTDGAYGGASFYANWLGFEGNDLEAVIDLGETERIIEISTAFLQVVNHIVFFPEEVRFSVSTDGERFRQLGRLRNAKPLTPGSKVNDIQYFALGFRPLDARYIKIEAKNMKTAPEWHHGSGLPAWIFIDEVEVR